MDILEKKVNELESKIRSMESELLALRNNSSQKEIFTGQVVFRGSVYDKSGNKVIN